jgi:hypothetical protein
MKFAKTYHKDCSLCWDVYIICICNVLILSDYCVTMKNELPVIFASLGSEDAECSVLSRIIGRVLVNSTKFHQVNESCKFRVGACNLGMSIQVRVPGTHQVPDPMGLGMGMIFYPQVAPVPDLNRDGMGRVFFPAAGNPMGTRYFTTALILDCEQVKMCSFCDIDYDLF